MLETLLILCGLLLAIEIIKIINFIITTKKDEEQEEDIEIL